MENKDEIIACTSITILFVYLQITYNSLSVKMPMV